MAGALDRRAADAGERSEGRQEKRGQFLGEVIADVQPNSALFVRRTFIYFIVLCFPCADTPVFYQKGVVS